LITETVGSMALGEPKGSRRKTGVKSTTRYRLGVSCERKKSGAPKCATRSASFG
jgi:hypothetical protein